MRSSPHGALSDRPINLIPNNRGLSLGSSSKGQERYTPGRLDDPLALHNVFIMEDITAGAEQGFILPAAGKDGEWAKKNMAEIEKRAREGDASMRTMAEEMKKGFGKSRL